MPRRKKAAQSRAKKALKMHEVLQMREARERGEFSHSEAPPAEQGLEQVFDVKAPELHHEDDDSEEEICLQIKEEVDAAIPVEFLASASELPLQPPQFNISVAPTSVGCNEPAYSISINEIRDPLSQDNTSTIHCTNNPNNIPLHNDSLLQPRCSITVPDDLLRLGQYDNVRRRGRPKKTDAATELDNGIKKRKIKEKQEKEAGKETVVRRNPPRQTKTMTYAQELMDRKLKDIMLSQTKILLALKEMPNVATATGKEDESKPSSKEDRFDICGRHIASLLRELPTFDALALEAKLMDIVYKEREKLETFRKSMQSYSTVLTHKEKVNSSFE